jgi:hypothetical protein
MPVGCSREPLLAGKGLRAGVNYREAAWRAIEKPQLQTRLELTELPASTTRTKALRPIKASAIAQFVISVTSLLTAHEVQARLGAPPAPPWLKRSGRDEWSPGTSRSLRHMGALTVMLIGAICRSFPACGLQQTLQRIRVQSNAWGTSHAICRRHRRVQLPRFRTFG